MQRIGKILVVFLFIFSLATQISYANSASDWFTRSVPSWGNRNIYKPMKAQAAYVVKAGRAAIRYANRNNGHQIAIVIGLGASARRFKQSHTNAFFASDILTAIKKFDVEYLVEDAIYHLRPIVNFVATFNQRTCNHFLDLAKAEHRGGISDFVNEFKAKLSYGGQWITNDVVRFQVHSIPGLRTGEYEKWSNMIDPNCTEVANAAKRENVDVINSGQSDQYSLNELGLPHIDGVSDGVRYSYKGSTGSDWMQTPGITLKTHQGDCEDNAIAIASILEKNNRQYRVIEGRKKDGTDGHVWVETKDDQGNRWIIDWGGATRSPSTRENPMGQIPLVMCSRNTASGTYNPNW